MTKLLDTTPKKFSRYEAEEIAEALQDGDVDWSYPVIDDPEGTGLSMIAIYDEEGEFVAYW